jgi:hypothetical protein
LASFCDEAPVYTREAGSSFMANMDRNVTRRERDGSSEEPPSRRFLRLDSYPCVYGDVGRTYL